MAVQEGLTGIRVSWIPPTPLGDTTGFRIYYSGGSSGSVDVSGGSTDNYTLTGLQNGANYTISIVGTSEHLPSDRVDYPNSIPLSEYFLCQCLRHYCTLHNNSRHANCNSELNHSHHHLALLECSQWLNGGQL